MKKTLCKLMLVLFVVNNMFAQNVVWEFSSEKQFFVGMTYIVKLGNLKCDSVILSSTKADISKKEDCQYKIIIKENGIIVFEAKKIIDKDTIVVENYSIYASNYKDFSVGLSPNGDKVVSANALKYHKGLYCWNNPNYGCFTCKIKRFKVLILRENEMIGIVNNEGQLFSQETLLLFEKTRNGDELYFLEIFALDLHNNEIQLNSPPVIFLE